MDTVSSHAQNGKYPYPHIPLTSGVYQITNTLTGDFYIGSSANITERWKDHVRKLRVGKNKCTILQRAWSKYGEEAFTFSVVEATEREKTALLAREQFYIDTLKPAYNSTLLANSHLGMKRSEETKAKLRQRVTSEETKGKIRQSLRGQTLTEDQKAKHLAATQSPEHREKLRRARALRPPISEETRAKMREAQRINNNKPGARERQSQSHRGVSKSPEHLANWSKSRMGHPVSEETRERMRQSRLAYLQHQKENSQ